MVLTRQARHNLAWTLPASVTFSFDLSVSARWNNNVEDMKALYCIASSSLGETWNEEDNFVDDNYVIHLPTVSSLEISCDLLTDLRSLTLLPIETNVIDCVKCSISYCLPSQPVRS